MADFVAGAGVLLIGVIFGHALTITSFNRSRKD